MNGGVTISALQIFELFPDDESARICLEGLRWGVSPVCPHCGCCGKINGRQGKRVGYVEIFT